MASWSSNTPIEDEPGEDGPETPPTYPTDTDEEFFFFGIPQAIWAVVGLFALVGAVMLVVVK